MADEAHYLKSPSANRTQAFYDIARNARRVWLLSGTPAPNNAAELYPMARAFGVWDRGYWEFVERYCTSVDTAYGKKITGGRNLDELKMKLAPIMLRRKKDDVLDLPPIVYSDVVVEPSVVEDQVWQCYFTDYIRAPQVLHKHINAQTALLDQMRDVIGLQNPAAMQVLSGLEQKCQSMRQWIGLQKVPKVIELVTSELESNAYQKIVLFGVHRAVLEELQLGLAKFGAVKIYGGTPANRRDRVIRSFQNNPKTRVFIGQVVAAGTAITLTAAHDVMVVEADWTPANNSQAVMRVHRIGQKERVRVRFVGMQDSIDQHIQRVLKLKTKTLTEIFDRPVDPFVD